jgi:hypothetical protein
MNKANGAWTAGGIWMPGAANAFNQRKVATGRSPQSAVIRTSAPPMEGIQLPATATSPTNATPKEPKSHADAAFSEQPTTLQSLPLERLLTTRQAAPILSESVDTLKKWRQRGLGPAYIKYESGAIRYRLSDLWQYLDDHTVECSSRKRRKQSLSEQTSGVRKKPLRTAA